MDNSNILISWIIIGQDWSDDLIDALNKQLANINGVELIIIDDFSLNNSIELLNNIEYKNKQIIKLEQQSGRCVARNQGINIASGKYCLFTNSNTFPLGNFLQKYIDILSESDLHGLAGVINYDSEDTSFEQYLNNNKRGLKQYRSNDILPIGYVLFGNCAIQTNLLKQVNGFSEKLNGYGGEEIELLYRISQNHNLKIGKINAVVLRHHHPDFNVHCNRLIEFGETNFRRLPFTVQKDIIPGVLLKLSVMMPVSIMHYISMYIKDNISGDNFLMMRIAMGLSILKGYKS